jgi:hypothetical protein
MHLSKDVDLIFCPNYFSSYQRERSTSFNQTLDQVTKVKLEADFYIQNNLSGDFFDKKNNKEFICFGSKTGLVVLFKHKTGLYINMLALHKHSCILLI